jgi:hypothetical protein
MVVSPGSALGGKVRVKPLRLEVGAFTVTVPPVADWICAEASSCVTPNTESVKV